ncbi:MAG: hypothetical protein MI746_03335 [Pseudomonadales bacterium]|nr:hypothetical protein [Pseudomonadales bacterium]
MEVKLLGERVVAPNPLFADSPLPYTELRYSWKAQVDNTCNSQLITTLSLSRSFTRPFTIFYANPRIVLEPQSSDNILRGNGVINASDFSPFGTFQLRLTAISESDPEFFSCIEARALDPISLFPVPPGESQSFSELSWGVDLINHCDIRFDASGIIGLIDDEGFLLNWAEDRDVIVPAAGTGKARDLVLFPSTDINGYATTVALANQGRSPSGNSTTITRWLESATVVLSTDTNLVSLDAEIGSVGYFQFDFVRRPDLGADVYQIDDASFGKLSGRPVVSTVYSELTSSLVIPSLELDDNVLVSNATFELFDTEQLLFRLVSFDSAEDREGAFDQSPFGNCLFVSGADSTWERQADDNYRITWDITANNECNFDHRMRIGYQLLNQDDMILFSWRGFNRRTIEGKSFGVRVGGSPILDISNLPAIPVREKFMMVDEGRPITLRPF